MMRGAMTKIRHFHQRQAFRYFPLWQAHQKSHFATTYIIDDIASNYHLPFPPDHASHDRASLGSGSFNLQQTNNSYSTTITKGESPRRYLCNRMQYAFFILHACQPCLCLDVWEWIFMATSLHDLSEENDPFFKLIHILT